MIQRLSQLIKRYNSGSKTTQDSGAYDQDSSSRRNSGVPCGFDADRDENRRDSSDHIDVKEEDGDVGEGESGIPESGIPDFGREEESGASVSLIVRGGGKFLLDLLQVCGRD